MRGLRLPEILALAITVLGLGLLAFALESATPPVFFGTEEEVAARERGQSYLVPAGGVLAVAATILAARRHPVHALFVLAPAVVCVALARVWPQALYGPLAFLVLAPAGLVAALAASLPGPGSASD